MEDRKNLPPGDSTYLIIPVHRNQAVTHEL